MSKYLILARIAVFFGAIAVVAVTLFGTISPMDVQLGKTKEKAMLPSGPTCFFGFDHVEEE